MIEPLVCHGLRSPPSEPPRSGAEGDICQHGEVREQQMVLMDDADVTLLGR